MSRRRQSLTLGIERPDGEQGQRVLLFRLVLATAQELHTRMDRVLAGHGLTTAQAMLLQRLQAEPEPPTMKRFAAGLAMSHQNLKQIALSLERKGFVEIRPDPLDARARRLHLTERHHQLWRERDDADHAEVARWTAALTADDVRVTVHALDALHEDLMRSRPDARGRQSSGSALVVGGESS